MPRTEASLAVRRVALNYLRLGTTLFLGLWFVRAAIGWVGDELFGLISLITVSIGLANGFRQLTNFGLIQELGSALHDPDPDRFGEVYASAFIVSVGVAAGCLVLYAAIFLALPLLEIRDDWMFAARVLTVGQAASSAFVVLVAPVFALYPARERFGGYALWIVLERSSSLLSVLLLASVFSVTGGAEGLVWFGILVAALEISFRLLAVLLVVIPNPRYRPRFSLARRSTARGVFGTFSWRGVAHVAMLLYENGTGLVMNIAHGLMGSAVYGLGLRLTSYVRMATTGVTFGTDATAARLKQGRGDDAVPLLAWHTTRFQALVALPAALVVAILCDPLMRVWVGRQVQDPAVIDEAIVLVRILATAITTRALADGWMTVLYGAGEVRRYAPLVFAGGVASLVIAGLMAAVVPDSVSWSFHAPAIAYAGVFTIVQLGILPFVVARALGIPTARVLAPAVRPAIVAVGALPVLFGVRWLVGDATIYALGAIIGAYGVAVIAGASAFVLTAAERRRLPGLLRRKRR